MPEIPENKREVAELLLGETRVVFRDDVCRTVTEEEIGVLLRRIAQIARGAYPADGKITRTDNTV